VKILIEILAWFKLWYQRDNYNLKLVHSNFYLSTHRNRAFTSSSFYACFTSLGVIDVYQNIYTFTAHQLWYHIHNFKYFHVRRPPGQATLHIWRLHFLLFMFDLQLNVTSNLYNFRVRWPYCYSYTPCLLSCASAEIERQAQSNV